jgi:hypothetical protein
MTDSAKPEPTLAEKNLQDLPKGHLPPGSGLYLALIDAAQACPNVAPDAENTFHHYKYASVEAVVTAVREVLLQHGIMFFRDLGKPFLLGEVTWMEMRFYLVHAETMQTRCDRMYFPIVQERGKSWDKACAVSLSAAKKYWLIDVLNLSRHDASDDMDSYDDKGGSNGGSRNNGSRNSAQLPRGRTPKQLPAAKWNYPFGEGNHREAVEWAMGQQAFPDLEIAKQSYKAAVEGADSGAEAAGSWVRVVKSILDEASKGTTETGNGPTNPLNDDDVPY